MLLKKHSSDKNRFNRQNKKQSIILNFLTLNTDVQVPKNGK